MITIEGLKRISQYCNIKENKCTINNCQIRQHCDKIENILSQDVKVNIIPRTWADKDMESIMNFITDPKED